VIIITHFPPPKQINTLYSWTNILTLDGLIKLIPTVATSLTLIFTLEHPSHPLALPSALLVRMCGAEFDA
jgi:hypothetical protein